SGRQEFQRHIQVAACLGNGGVTIRRAGRFRLCCEDLCAYGGTQRHKEGQQRQAVGLVAFVQIAVHDPIGLRAQTGVPQVHEQESEVVKNVDAADGFVEFDAVE